MIRSTHLIAIAAGLALSACAGKDAPKADSGKAPAAPASLASYDATTHTVTLHAKDFSFDAPDSVQSGWTTFHLVNDGPKIHHASLIRLDSSKTVADVNTALASKGPPPRWMIDAGGPNAPDPTTSSDAAFDLVAGNYAIICFVDSPDHVPHAMKGMIRALTVVAATGAPAPEPASDATVTLSDYSFTVAAPPTGGKHTFKIINKGPQSHEVELIRLEPGKTVKDAAAFLYDTTGKTPPPMHALGGVSGLGTGMTAYATFDLTPGNYAMLCFLPAPDGKMHLEHGMIKEFVIK